jgi:prepilin-type N-terminal cleavage/methylation domain-containing protein
MQNTKHNSGFTLVETMVALAVLSIVLVGLGQLFFSASQQTEQAKAKAAAVELQQQISLQLKSGPPTGP